MTMCPPLIFFQSFFHTFRHSLWKYFPGQTNLYVNLRTANFPCLGLGMERRCGWGLLNTCHTCRRLCYTRLCILSVSQPSLNTRQPQFVLTLISFPGHAKPSHGTLPILPISFAKVFMCDFGSEKVSRV